MSRTRKEFAARQAAHDAAADRTQAEAQARANAAMLDEIMREQEVKSPALKAKQSRLLAALKRGLS